MVFLIEIPSTFGKPHGFSFRGSRFGAAGAAERAAAGATAPFGGAAAATEGRGRAEELQGSERRLGDLESLEEDITVIYIKIITYYNIL